MGVIGCLKSPSHARFRADSLKQARWSGHRASTRPRHRSRPRGNAASRRPRRERGQPAPSGAQLGVIPELFHPLRQRVDLAARDEEALDTVADDGTGVRGDDAGQAARERLVGHDGRAFEERGEHEDVGRRQPRGHFGVSDSAQRLDDIQIRLERAEVCRQRTEKLEPPAGAADSPPGFEQVLDSLALADPPGEEERAFRPVALARERAEPAAVGGIGDHAHLAGGRPVPHQRFGDMVRRHEHAIGQREVAEPALVQPGQKLAIEARRFPGKSA